VLWILFFINAVGLFDNIDLGLSSFSLSFLIFLFIIGVINMTSYMVLLMISSYIGSILTFSFFNKYPSKIFMGEIGSLQIGSLLSLVSIHIIWSDYSELSFFNLFYNLLVVNIFNVIIFFDVLFVFYYRWKSKNPILKGDTTHLSHRFTNLGFSPNLFALFMVLMNAIAFLTYYSIEISNFFTYELGAIIICLYYTLLFILFFYFFNYKVNS